MPAKVITERLGHGNPAFTMKQYAHVIPGMQADAAELVARLIDPPSQLPNSSNSARTLPCPNCRVPRRTGTRSGPKGDEYGFETASGKVVVLRLARILNAEPA